MSETPEIGGRRTDPGQGRSRQELLVVRLRPFEGAAVLRRLAQGYAVRAARMESAKDEEAYFCACKRSSHQPLCDGSHKALT